MYYKIDFYLKEDAPILKIEDKRKYDSNILDISLEANFISKETGVPYQKVFPYVSYWYKIDSKWYYFKMFDDFLEGFLNTFLGSLISLYFGLRSANYKIAEVKYSNNTRSIGVASENFCSCNYRYKTSRELQVASVSSLQNIDKLRDFFDGTINTDELINDVKKLFIRDLFTGEIERYDDILFEINNESVRLAPLFDYEYSFSERALTWYYWNYLGKMNLFSKPQLEYFRSDSMFQELFLKLLNINIKEMLEKLSDENKIIIPNDYQEICALREAKVKKIIRSQKIVK